METGISRKKKVSVSGTEIIKTLSMDRIWKILGDSQDPEVSRILDKDYRDLKQEIGELLQGWFCYRFGSYQSRPALYLFCTVGRRLSELSGEKFKQGDYLKGVLADLIADQCLFSLENIWKERLAEECKREKLGIGNRLEAEKGCSAEIQKEIYEELKLEEDGVLLTSKFMYRPSKSLGYVWILDKEGNCSFEHDCSRCQSSKQCIWKN